MEIKDIGIVGLPLSSRDAAAIKEASHPAPFGKGSKTLVDGMRTTPRCVKFQAYQLNPAYRVGKKDLRD